LVQLDSVIGYPVIYISAVPVCMSIMAMEPRTIEVYLNVTKKLVTKSPNNKRDIGVFYPGCEV